MLIFRKAVFLLLIIYLNKKRLKPFFCNKNLIKNANIVSVRYYFKIQIMCIY